MSALMSQFDIARDSLKTALNDSEGSAERELSNYQEGIEYHLETLKASFQAFSTDTISSDLFKGAVDLLTTILNLLDKIVQVGNGIPAMLAGFGGYKLFKNLDLFYY